jgi:hypothetical protein
MNQERGGYGLRLTGLFGSSTGCAHTFANSCAAALLAHHWERLDSHDAVGGIRCNRKPPISERTRYSDPPRDAHST